MEETLAETLRNASQAMRWLEKQVESDALTMLSRFAKLKRFETLSDWSQWVEEQEQAQQIADRRSCNRHVDCEAANATAKAKGRFGADHCHDSCCEDCFGS